MAGVCSRLELKGEFHKVGIVRGTPGFVTRWIKVCRCLLLAAVVIGEANGKVVYVRTDGDYGAAKGTGKSWETAFTDLQSAIWTLEEGDEVWVAKGLYRPSVDNPRCAFLLIKNMRLYGGFDGTETSREEADPEKNPTVLSGDIDGDDKVDEFGVTLQCKDRVGGNSNQGVVRIRDAVGVIMDGFVICGGEGEIKGGGISVLGRSTAEISRCVIRGNTAPYGGGNAVTGNGNLTIRETRIIANEAKGEGAFGGGIGIYGDSVVIERCWIGGNWSSNRGGGVGLTNSVAKAVIRDSLISGNVAETEGAALQSWKEDSLFDLTNVTITGNLSRGSQ